MTDDVHNPSSKEVTFLPCPFCGSQPESHSYVAGAKSFAWVRCNSCRIDKTLSTDGVDPKLQAMVLTGVAHWWNGRATPELQPAASNGEAVPVAEYEQHIELTRELEREGARQVVGDVMAIAGERTDTYWAAHSQACEEILHRLQALWGPSCKHCATARPAVSAKPTSAHETPVKAWGGSDVCHTCAAHCVVIEDMRTALRDIKSFVGTGSYVGQEVALKVARALGEAYSAVETKLHEGYRQSFLKALEYAGASGLLGDGDKSDLLEIYKRLWPQAPADIRTEPFTPKASTNDVLDRNRDERFVGREIAGCSGGRCEVKDGKQLHCAKHWNELPENGTTDSGKL